MKLKITILAVALSIANLAHADTFLGADLDVGVWSPNYESSLSGDIMGEDSSIFGSLTFEHVVPLLPNLKASYSNVDSSVYQYTKMDYTTYYEILDNDIVSLDFGVGISQYSDGEHLSQSFSGVLPHLYTDLEVMLPFTGLALYTDIHYLDYDDNKVLDAIAGLRYDFNLIAVDVGLKAGYRVQEINAKDLDNLALDVKTDGWFLGLHADF